MKALRFLLSSRQIQVLAYWQYGFTQQETASRLHIRQQSVGASLTRAKRRLRSAGYGAVCSCLLPHANAPAKTQDADDLDRAPEQYAVEFSAKGIR